MPADYKAEYPWLKEVDSLALANAQLNLQTAYKNFCRDKAIGFPKFKSKHHDKRTCTTNNQGGTIRFIDEKHIRLHRHIPESGTIKSATISQTATGKYYISILVEYEKDIEAITPTPETVLG